MSSLELVRAGGRSLDRRLAAVPAEALLAGLRAAGAVSEPEVAALGRPAGSGWPRRLRALAVARGDRSCRVLLSVLERLEGPPRPGPFDFYDPQRDAAPGHRSDCPCCRPDTEWTREEDEDGGGGTKNGDEGHEDEDGGGDDEDDEGHEDEEGDEGGGDDEDEGDEGHDDDDEDEGDEGHDDDDDEDEGREGEGHEDDEDEGRDEDEGDEGHEEDEGEGHDEDGGDEGHDDDDDDDGGGAGDED